MVGGEPAFDEAMIAFCRWTADYYQAPLGEVLRAALPQGEQATASARVRLTDLGAAARSSGRGRCSRTRRATRCWARWPTRAASCRWRASSSWRRAPRRGPAQLARLAERG